MNIHKIQSHLHQSFLEEERKDAITGDLIQANDEVVFCGMCKSAFLKDSWVYVGKKHCGQLKTLKSVPISVPLLLNVSKIKPHFITLINSSISYEECLEMLSDFSPRHKKVEILLNPNLRKVLENPKEKPAKELIAEKSIKKPIKKLIEEKPIKSKPTKPKYQIRQDVIREKEQQEKRELQKLLKQKKTNFYVILVSIILGATSVFASLIFDVFFINLFFMISIIFVCCFFYFKSNLVSEKRQKKLVEQFPNRNRIVLETLKKEEEKEEEIKGQNKKLEEIEQNKPKIENPAIFGIFNHSLFVYFEKIEQGIFVELTRISDIEIQYQSNCCINLIMKKQDSTNKEITIPLIFSKTERVTTFLLRLSKAKKDISNHSVVKLTNFHTERIRVLKRKLMLTDIVFVESEKIEPKNDFVFNKTKPENEPISLQDLLQPRDLDRLVKSQKVSRQSQNRNQHYQNQHQTQYKNYKRK